MESKVTEHLKKMILFDYIKPNLKKLYCILVRTEICLYSVSEQEKDSCILYVQFFKIFIIFRSK